jgi:N-methylhydantoinase B
MPAYYRPRALDAALEIRADGPVTILAGGTDVYPAKAARAGWGDMHHADVLDISAIEALRGIRETAKDIRFGALTTWTDLIRAELPAAFDGYRAAAREVGGIQIQNRGTLVGNICTASPAGDGIPCLLALDAEVELASKTERRVLPIAAFVDDYRHTLCRSDEIVTGIRVPRPDPTERGRFLKLGARRYLVISIVMAAGIVSTDEAGRVAHARIAVGACSPVARRLPALEAALAGQPLAAAPDIVAQDHLAPLAPIDDIRSSGIFRHAAALELLRDLLAGFLAERERRAA